MRTTPLTIALAALTLSATAPAFATLAIGSKAPDFSTQATLGGKPFPFALSTALKKGLVVLYFFPKVFTSGCTVEAHDFAEATADFTKAGATVIGVSADSIEELSKFSTLECRNKFAVAVATPSMIKDYDSKLGIPFMGGRSNRTSYVIAPDGKIIYAFSALAAAGHVKNTLEAVRKYQTAHKKG